MILKITVIQTIRKPVRRTQFNEIFSEENCEIPVCPLAIGKRKNLHPEFNVD